MEMSYWTFAAWGFFGGVAIDSLDLWTTVKNNGGEWPDQYRKAAFIVAEFLRLCSGAGLATAFGISGQISGPLGAVMIGIGTPLLLEKIGKQVEALNVSESGDDQS